MPEKKQILKFDEFEKQSKVQWQRLATKTLKGKSIESLTWNVDSQIQLDPIYTADESITSVNSTGSEKKNNEWWIGEDFTVFNCKKTNLLLLQSLSNGLDSPCIFQPTEISKLLHEVRLDLIKPFFRDISPTFLSEYDDHIEALNYTEKKLMGGIIAIDHYDGEDLTKDQIEHVRAISQRFPLYYYSEIELSFSHENIGLSLASQFNKLIGLILQLIENGLNPRIVCSIELDDDYVKCIALVRAIRILIFRINKIYKLEDGDILMDVYVNQSAMDLQLGIVGATAKTLAAVCGGADRITIHCEAMNVKEDEAISRRMIRNIHHVMKMESGLHLQSDPLKGSYTIEHLTSFILDQINEHIELKEKR